MATPMSADQLLAALKAEELHVVEHAGWRDHNREGHGGWGPMNGVMIHHTAGAAPGDGSVVWSGRSDLPGPLAHGYLAKDGTVTMTANGRANHAGGGSAAVLAAVVAEAATPPATHFHDGSAGAVDGNAHFYGLEISNLGTKTDSYPTAQYGAAVRWAAGICRHHGWSAHSVIGHKEWSDWKNDPSFDMGAFRADVTACLAAKPGAWGAIPAPAQTKESSMDLTPDQIRQIARQVITGANGMHAPDDTTKEWAVSAYLPAIYREVQQLAAAAAPEIDYAKLAAALLAQIKSA